MNRPRFPSALNAQSRAEATEWLLRFSEGEVDAAGREAFSSWLKSSPEHVRAYLRVCAFWQEAGRLDGQPAPRDIDALVSGAMQEANIFPLALGRNLAGETAGQGGEDAVLPIAQNAVPFRRRLLAIAASVLAAVGAIGAYEYGTRDIYETGIGEQRTLSLSDGSMVVLNADSRVKVRYSEAERSLVLDQGQALFTVAKQASRPFVVRSGEARVQALGTQFDVYRRTTGVTVTVVEGEVAVAADRFEDSIDRPLIAGEQLTISKASAPNGLTSHAGASRELQVRSVKVEAFTAWTEGLLVFDGAPLGEVVEEFNRQNHKRLVIRGKGLADLRISGSFPANGSDRIIRFLEERFGVVVYETQGEIVLSRQ